MSIALNRFTDKSLSAGVILVALSSVLVTASTVEALAYGDEVGGIRILHVAIARGSYVTQV